MSNELSTPKNCYCPSDISAAFGPNTDTPASGSISGPICSVANDWSHFNQGTLSYFVEGDASDKFPQMMLLGDRNIGTVPLASWGSLPATSMNMVNQGYAEVNVTGVNGLVVRGFGWGWTDLDIHQDSGNLGMADGSAQQSSLSGLAKALTDTVNARGKGPPSMLNVILNMP
jgi:hypothetical protein